MSAAYPYNTLTTTTINHKTVAYLGGNVEQKDSEKPVDPSIGTEVKPLSRLYDPTTQTVDIKKLDAVLRSGYNAPVSKENKTEHVSFNLINAMKEQGSYKEEPDIDKM